ncbi:hypothetical protein ACC691_39125, partial [Rhizobium johnstonii]|uniref:hypothetical protein n=1 Tax=Rhizobium johnstonii TaxID=3019933 RepID=UPI003F96A068
ADSARRAFEITDAVVSVAKERLVDLQNSVSAPADSQVRMTVITDNTEAVPVTSTLIRALIIVVAVGIIATLLIALAIDALARRRRDRRS